MTFLNIFISIINPHESAYFIKLMNDKYDYNTHYQKLMETEVVMIASL